MNDIITKARQRWVTPFPYAYVNTAVVAALLDVLDASMKADICPGCGTSQWTEHSMRCRVAAAFDAITRELEGK